MDEIRYNVFSVTLNPTQSIRSTQTVPSELYGFLFLVLLTACTVVKANSQSNGNWQISTPSGSLTTERISMKLGICNYVGGMTTHANPHGAAKTWVVSANT